MACIVGIAKDGVVWMGCDSQSSRNGVKALLAEGKLAERGEFLIGACGTLRHVNLTRHVFCPPPLTACADLDCYMSDKFVAAWRGCLKENGLVGQDDDHEETNSAVLLVGVRGALYVIDNYCSVTRGIDPYHAIGSGGEVALGSLSETEGREPEDRIMRALRAAQKHADGVGAPFHVKSVGLKEPPAA